jgi:hypothetical protein
MTGSPTCHVFTTFSKRTMMMMMMMMMMIIIIIIFFLYVPHSAIDIYTSQVTKLTGKSATYM